MRRSVGLLRDSLLALLLPMVILSICEAEEPTASNRTQEAAARDRQSRPIRAQRQKRAQQHPRGNPPPPISCD